MSQSGSLFNFVQLKKLLKMSHDEALMATGCSLLLLAGVVVLFGIYAACKIETKSDELRGNLFVTPALDWRIDFRCGRDRQQRPIKQSY